MTFQQSKYTDMISLYIPPQRPIDDLIGQLINEDRISNDIKSDTVRYNIQNTLNKIILFVGLLKKIPSNGMVIFGHEGLLSIVLPLKRININLYRCDNHFYTEVVNE